MVEFLALESFVSAVACLCIASYGPNIKSQLNLEENIVNTLSSWDQDTLKMFVNSNPRFSFNDETSRCALPDSEDINSRLNDLEYDIQKQRQQNKRLTEELKSMRTLCKESEQKIIVVEADKNEISNLKAQTEELRKSFDNFKKFKEDEIRNLNVKHKNEILQLQHDIEILNKKLFEAITKTPAKIVTITTTTPLPPTQPPKPKNGCLQTQKHGVSNLEICFKQKIFCAKDLDPKHGDGWMLMSQRFDGSINFYRDWTNYVEGFGRHGAKFEFFVGLERIYTLTKSANHELLFVLTDIYNQTKYAHYNDFSIGDATQNYILQSLGKYTGDAGDSLSYHIGQKFSTFDKNNESNCATKHTGAWWYKNGDCHRSNLFGIYRSERSDGHHKLNGMIWSTFHNGSLVSMRMYLRPIDDMNYLN